MMGEWSVTRWILGVMRFQKIFGLKNVLKWRNVQVRRFLGEFGGSGGSVWVMGQ